MLGLSGVYAECDLSCNAIPVFIAVYTNYTDFIYVVFYILYGAFGNGFSAATGVHNFD